VKKVLILFFLISSLFLFAQEEKPLISVFDFSGSNISEQELLLFVDFISSNVVESDKYIVIDRMQRETILKEIEFSLTGCTDESCQLEAGKLLQANEIIVGSLGAFGDKTLVNIKLVEVETGATLSSVSETYASFEEVVVDNARIVGILIGTQPKQQTTPLQVMENPNDVQTVIELFYQVDDFIKQDLDDNFRRIQSLALQLSPKDRRDLYDRHKRNATIGTVLNTLPGFGLGNFVNDNNGLGVALGLAETLAYSGIVYYLVQQKIEADWAYLNKDYFVQDDTFPTLWDWGYGYFQNENGVMTPPVPTYYEAFGVIGLIILGASKIVGISEPLITTQPYNEKLANALNVTLE